jgi:YD repeat-containing protein
MSEDPSRSWNDGFAGQAPSATAGYGKPSSLAVVAVAAVFLASAVRSAEGQIKPAPPPGPAFSTGPCRTFDTSVTSVTAGGPVKATVDWTGGFDPYSLRFVQNINVSTSQGARFSYVQVTTYPTAEDFIAEIVRFKPPATLATNPNGPILNIIPPLTRSRSTTGNGAIALSKTNRHDTNGRLTGYSARSAGGTISMQYSAWDALGRPTAGAMQSPTGPSTQTITYDDKAMSMTETTTSKGLTSTMTYTYDQSGNLRSTAATITRGQPSTTTVTSHSSDTICLGDTLARTLPRPKPAGPNPAGTFSGTIGSQSWSAALGLTAANNGAVVSVGGGDKRYTVSIGMSVKPGPGEYKAGSIADEDFTKMTKDDFALAIDRNSVIATVTDTVTRQSWMASPTLGKGTVSLTSVAGTAAGTFSLTLEPVPGTGASGSLNFSGAFNIKF